MTRDRSSATFCTQHDKVFVVAAEITGRMKHSVQRCKQPYMCLLKSLIASDIVKHVQTFSFREFHEKQHSILRLSTTCSQRNPADCVFQLIDSCIRAFALYAVPHHSRLHTQVPGYAFVSIFFRVCLNNSTN